tara:strand:+ start:1172 stop:1348 length:177 start_codon:yes stop_codon:yes gene_type:complete
MEIKNAKYLKDIVDNKNMAVNAEIDGEKVTVPLDPDNRHYAEILKQVDSGTLTIADAD